METSEEQVQFDILLEAQQAIEQLKEFYNSVSISGDRIKSTQESLKLLEASITQVAETTKREWNDVIAEFELLDAKLRQQGASLFGGSPDQNVFNAVRNLHNAPGLTEEYRASGDALQEYNRQLMSQGQLLVDVQNAQKGVGQAGKQAGEDSAEGATKATNATYVWHRAISILLYQAIFAVIGAFQQMFSTAIKGLKDMESATYNLINAEKRASEAGVAITPKDLENTVSSLEKLDPLISKVQATQAVAGIATKLIEPLGLQKKDIDSLSQSIAVLAVRNQAAGKSFEDIANEVSNSLLSGRVSKGINDLGIKLNDQIVKENAVKMGLVENAKAYDDLDGKQKAYITSLSIINELEKNTAEERKNLPSYLNTVSAAQDMLSAKWQDFLVMVAKLYGPEIIEGLKFLIYALTTVMHIVEAMQPFLETAMKLWVGLFRASEAYFAVVSRTDLSNWEKTKAVFEALKGGIADTTQYFQNFGDAVDTATAQVADSTTQNLEKAMAEFDKFKTKLQDVIQSYKNKEEDLNIQFNPATGTGRKVEDLNTEYANKEADAYQNLQDKIYDINQDINKKEQDLKAKARLDELKAEKDHQEKLKQLRERYLLDLEEALHNRDARAVLRLQAQYQLDVAQENRKYNTDAELRKKAIEQERKDLEKERERRIAEAQLEYQRKLRDLEVAKAREYETIVKWRQREEDDLRRDITRRLQALVTEYLASEALTSAYLANLLLMTNQFAQQLGSTLDLSGYSQGGGLGTSTAPIGTANGGTAGTSLGTFSGGLANGGSFLAQTPRSINVAEDGPEIITATPLTKLGSNINKLFLDAGLGAKGGQQKIYVQVDLSPDLESRVVQKSMDATANVIQRVNRSQV